MNILKDLVKLAIKTFAILCISLNAHAIAPKTVTKQIKDWNYYEYEDDDRKVCMVYSASVRNKSSYKADHMLDPGYLYFQKKGENEYTLAYNAAYEIDEERPILFHIGERSYSLKAGLPTIAWTYSSVNDVEILDHLIEADDVLTIKTDTRDDNTVTAYFSLKGFLSALKVLEKCEF